MKKHPLHTVEFIRCCKDRTGEYPYERSTGRSTRLALKAIAKAIGKPGKKIKIEDHHKTAAATRHLCMTIRAHCSHMGLRHMHVDMLRFTLTFEDRT